MRGCVSLVPRATVGTQPGRGENSEIATVARSIMSHVVARGRACSSRHHFLSYFYFAVRLQLDALRSGDPCVALDSWRGYGGGTVFVDEMPDLNPPSIGGVPDSSPMALVFYACWLGENGSVGGPIFAYAQDVSASLLGRCTAEFSRHALSGIPWVSMHLLGVLPHLPPRAGASDFIAGGLLPRPS